MNYNIYIEQPGNQFVNDLTYTAYVGFKDRGFNIFFFEDQMEVPAKKNNIVIGFIETTLKFFERLKINIPHSLHIPEEIRSFACRDFTILTKKILMNPTIELKYPIFLKSYDKIKLFPSSVVNGELSKDSLLYKADNEERSIIEDNERIFVSEYLNIVSEYRCFIHNTLIKDMKHYLGDFGIFPDMNIIRSCINEYRSQPISFTADFGITDDNKTVLIECNDAWSIGPYGLDPKIYSMILLDRWIEIMKNN